MPHPTLPLILCFSAAARISEHLRFPIMTSKIVSLYREIYADVTIDREEAAELQSALRERLNPPPDLVHLRATAFRVACEHLSDDDKDHNVSLLRTINCIVHAIEQTYME